VALKAKLEELTTTASRSSASMLKPNMAVPGKKVPPQGSVEGKSTRRRAPAQGRRAWWFPYRLPLGGQLDESNAHLDARKQARNAAMENHLLVWRARKRRRRRPWGGKSKTWRPRNALLPIAHDDSLAAPDREAGSGTRKAA